MEFVRERREFVIAYAPSEFAFGSCDVSSNHRFCQTLDPAPVGNEGFRMRGSLRYPRYQGRDVYPIHRTAWLYWSRVMSPRLNAVLSFCNALSRHPAF